MGTLRPFANDCKRLPPNPQALEECSHSKGNEKELSWVRTRDLKEGSFAVSLYTAPSTVGLGFRPFKDLGTSG